MTHAEVMRLLFEEQEIQLEAARIVAWVTELRRRLANLEEVQP